MHMYCVNIIIIVVDMIIEKNQFLSHIVQTFFIHLIGGWCNIFKVLWYQYFKLLADI